MLDVEDRVEKRRPRGSVARRPTAGGALLALLFWWESLTPTLVPRPWLTQALVGAACTAIGYAIGTLVWRWMLRLIERRRPAAGPTTRRWGGALVGLAWLAGIVVGSLRWLASQNDQRDLMGMPRVAWTDVLLVVVVSTLAGALLVVVGRVIGNGLAASTTRGRRHGAGVLPRPTTVLLVIVLLLALSGEAVYRGVTVAASRIFGPTNEQTEEGVVRPDSASVSGGPGSLVAWETLGRTGREFVAGVTTADELAAFHGSVPPRAPVRVYVGVRSADTLQARAELAVRELERTGGFEREILVVWVPTGTGWMIPEATEAIEQLYGGDTAIVAVQYSYLPSIVSVLLDPGLAVEAASALFHAVEERWKQLPPGDRPRLLMFGKSLGTAGVEEIFGAVDAHSSIGNLTARTDGALIVGAKKSNPILSQVTRGRDAGSPVWQPVFEEGRTVRFLSRDPDQPRPSATAPGPRIVFLQHPSDPVPFWGLDVVWRPPEWMDGPRGYDVPDDAHWFPLVTAVQAVGDQLHQLYAPPGFGHDYATDYARGWAELLPPDGWTDTDTARLEEFLDHGAPEESEP